MRLDSRRPTPPSRAMQSHESLRDSEPKPDFLATDHLQQNLKGRAVSSGVVTVSAQAANFLLTMGSTVVLARLLSPEDFGLFAMVLTVMGFFKNFKNAGLSAATIQRASITHAQVSNLFWINVALGVAACLLIASLSPVVAWFFEDPRLVALTLTLSLAFVFEGLSVQNMAILNRQMRFKAVAVVQIGALVASIATGVLMAASGFGYWSLIYMQLALPAATFALSWTLCGWRPSWPRRHVGTKPLVGFGANLTASSFVYSFIGGLDSLLIGKLHGAEVVGQYSRAGALMRRPMEQLLSPINRVFIPVLSRMQDQPERYRSAFIQLFNSLALVSFVFSALCLPLARPITLVLLGPQWEPAAVIFACFTVSALFTPLAATCSWLFESQGRGRDALKMSVLSSSTTLVAVLFGLPFGATGVALSWALSSVFVQLPMFFHMAGKAGAIRTGDLWSGFLRHAPVWLVVAAAAHGTLLIMGEGFSPLEQLVVGTLAGLVASLVAIFAWPPARHTFVNISGALKSVRRGS